LTGKGKRIEILTGRSGYLAYEFLSDQMSTALAAADVVVSRAGFGAISELAALSKPTILVPLPDSPQVLNAEALGDAVVTVHTERANWEETLEEEIVHLLNSAERREALGDALHERIPTDDGSAMANLIFSVMK
jgi:UDP-N-acetylglucosamine--N-acetylmuramyl-(pentapeptide) pyrophosphoryl-undecaprenol N-acetylglucosamine transferase